MTKKIKSWGFSLLATLVTAVLGVAVARMFPVGSFVFSWVLNFLLMTWYTVVITLLNPALQWSYFQPKAFEKDGQIYSVFGVHLFRKLLVMVGWEKLSKQKNPVKNNQTCLELCERNTRISELGHVLIAALVFAVALAATSSLQEAKWLIGLNVLLNIYPVLLQRYNRPRYRKVLQRMRASKAKEPDEVKATLV